MATDLKSITDKTSVSTTLGFIFAIVIAVWVASSKWSKAESNDVSLIAKVQENTLKIADLQTTTGNLHDQVTEIRAEQRSQTKLLEYLANGRSGPKPETIAK